MTDHRNHDAAAWVARLHADDRTIRDEGDFHAWLNADDAHRARFEHVSTVWDDVGSLRGEIQREPIRDSMLTRRGVMAGMAAVAACGVGLFTWTDAHAGVYSTAVGEQKRVTLPDGSRLFLDTNTSLQVRQGSSLRRLSLRQGRMHSDIAADKRPFEIEAGSRKLIAGSGSFDVQYDTDHTAFIAVEGEAVIRDEGGGSAGTRVAAGDRFRSMDGRAILDRPDVDDMLVWQSGRAIFRDVTLASAVAEMNRYSEQELVVADPRSAALRLSGLYRVGDNVRFARTITDLLPVRADIRQDRIILTET
jgi:transmembrane sensor